MKLTAERNVQDFLMVKTGTEKEVGPGVYPRYASFERQQLEKATFAYKRTKSI